ncbi:peptide ABC transporter permease [Spirochaetia bacterium]|nr:peptide ABC transporter permease [Spirochaetia bacterium]
MTKFLGERLLQSLIILFGVSCVVFVLVNCIPGNPYLSMFPPDIPTDQIEAMLRRVGYYDSLPVKYFKWVSRILQGDFGYSIFYHEKVSGIIASRMGNTILLSVSAITISILAGVSVGIFTAKRKGSLTDNSISVVTYIVLSLPSFFLGMLLLKIFGADLRLLPISGKVTAYADYYGFAYVADVARHMLMPSIVLGLGNAATMLRYTRSSVAGILAADYIRTARSHGLRESTIASKHTLKNIMIPVVTVLSLQIPDLLSGALLTETVFSWPGIGRLSYDAVRHRDYPLIMGILLVMAVITLAANFIADVAYAMIDRRITLGKGNEG